LDIQAFEVLWSDKVVRENSKHVNDVHEASEKLEVVRTGKKTANEFQSKPSHVDGLQCVYYRIII
jgi:hypothetical protein